jgi:hypothetical protein|tara:strand:- start:775 stop:1314 length:540 start_codon:yes stop_codon:yes gene_type:complete
MASEVKTITSESLEAAYRALTPSQSGFTQDLMASNTIIPVLDLTASAEGTSTPQYLQTALAYGSQTAFDVVNTTTVIANTAGFWRVIGTFTGRNQSGSDTNLSFTMTDGVSSKRIYGGTYEASGNESAWGIAYDFTVFLRSGDSISAVSTSAKGAVVGSIRQVADVNGVLVNPAGFTPQ